MRRKPAIRYAALVLELIGVAAVEAAIATVSWQLALAVGGVLFAVTAQLLDKGVL